MSLHDEFRYVDLVIRCGLYVYSYVIGQYEFFDNR